MSNPRRGGSSSSNDGHRMSLLSLVCGIAGFFIALLFLSLAGALIGVILGAFGVALAKMAKSLGDRSRLRATGLAVSGVVVVLAVVLLLWYVFMIILMSAGLIG